MAYLPVKARSELVEPSKRSGDLVVESRRMFQNAVPASYIPALNPTRGSGLGGRAPAIRDGAGVPPPAIVPPDEHPAASSPRTSEGRTATRARRDGIGFRIGNSR